MSALGYFDWQTFADEAQADYPIKCRLQLKPVPAIIVLMASNISYKDLWYTGKLIEEAKQCRTPADLARRLGTNPDALWLRHASASKGRP